MNLLKPIIQHFWFSDRHFRVLLLAGLLLIVFAVIASNVVCFSGWNVNFYLVVLVPLITGLFILGDIFIAWLYTYIWRMRRPIKKKP